MRKRKYSTRYIFKMRRLRYTIEYNKGDKFMHIQDFNIVAEHLVGEN